MKYLQNITGTTKGLKTEVNIPLSGRNLIITGQNGVGKTFFLNQVNNVITKELISKLYSLSEENLKIKKRFFLRLDRVLEQYPFLHSQIDINELKKLKNLSMSRDVNEKKNNDFFGIAKTILSQIYEIMSFSRIKYNSNYLLSLDSYNEDPRINLDHIHPDSYHEYRLRNEADQLKYHLNKMNLLLDDFDIFTTLGSDLKVKIENLNELNQDIQLSKITFNYFSAFRQTQITHSTNTMSLEDYISTAKNGYENNLGQLFEQYLVNIKIEKSLALTESSNFEYANKIDKWFDKLNYDLKYIFEDESTYLDFDYKTKKFIINQDSKKFNFQTLSSGYSSIFAIYTELMLRSQFLNLLPDELNGIVLIDEIDAHLHISLQRKILPFFIKSFPNIQFIVTTHSPFVITSANDDTVIFDLTNGNFIDENLSSYSVESITQELLHVNTESLDLKKSIDYIYESINSENIDFEILNSELKKLQPYKSKLNIESKSIYMQGLNFLIDNDKLGDLDV